MQLILYGLRKSEFKMSQQEMADHLGISVQQYRLKEKGKYEFTQDEMFSISNLFDKSIDEIFLPREHQIGNNVKQKV